MQIAIIGAGNVGKALAQGWIAAGHHIKFGVRNPQAPPADGPAGARLCQRRGRGPGCAGGRACHAMACGARTLLPRPVILPARC